MGRDPFLTISTINSIYKLQPYTLNNTCNQGIAHKKSSSHIG